jgi:phytanoyl-CoA hydroxylase
MAMLEKRCPVNGDAFSDAERRAYTDDGFVVRQNLYSDSEVDALGGRVDVLIDQVEQTDALTSDEKHTILRRNAKAAAPSGQGSLNSLFRIHLFSRLVRDHIRDPRRVAPVNALLGTDLFCPNDLYFFKPPGTGRPITWHQDSWYFQKLYTPHDGESLEDTSIGTWLAVDDATVENGCLWVLPGSHNLGISEHDEIPEVEELPVRHRVILPESEEERAIPVVVSKGSLVFFNNALLHRSTPNLSNTFRRAYVVHYMTSTIRHADAGRRGRRPKGMGDWGSVEASVSGQLHFGCVKMTSEAESLNWDGIGELLTEDVTISG